MRLRGYRIDRGRIPESEAPDGGRGSFLELAAVPRREVVLGIAGRFWRLDGGIVRGLTPVDFADFRCQGYAKAVWNSHPQSPAHNLAPKRGYKRSAVPQP
jgi:hypothetical protein